MNRVWPCLLLAFALQIHAADDPASTPVPIGAAIPDSAALRFEAYQALANADLFVGEHNVPSSSRINVYVSQGGPSRLKLRGVRYSIDNGAQHVFNLDGPVTEAIAGYDDLHRLDRFSLAAGSHVIHTEFNVDKANGTSVVVTSDDSFEKADGEIDLDLRLEPRTVFSAHIKPRWWQRNDDPDRKVLGIAFPQISTPWTSQFRYRSGSADDPALVYARQLARIGQTGPALVELLRMQAGIDALETPAPEYQLEMAHELRSLGMIDRAQALCDALDQQHMLAADVATERLFIAKARYAVGDLDGTETQLQKSSSALPDFRLPDWRYTRGMVLLSRQRPTEAAEMLGEPASDSVDAYRYMRASTEAIRSTTYGRFNLAVAMIETGDEQRGLSWLDLIGRSQSNDPELLALRDRANLALGWHFLKAKQGRTAVGVLGRVRSEGPFSDRALLGMGWAQLAPNGERLPRVQLAVEPPRAPDQIDDLPAPIKNSLTRLRVLEPELHGAIGPRTFEQEDPPKDPDEGLRRALNIWNFLLKQDRRGDATLEAMMATGYAYDQLREPIEARKAYTGAIEALKHADAELAEGSAFVDEGRFPSAVADSADDDALFLLMDRLHLSPGDSNDRLYSMMQQYRDLSRLQAALDEAKANLTQLPISGVEDVRGAAMARLVWVTERIAHQRDADASDIGILAKSSLDRRSKPVTAYLKSALFLSARIEDQPMLESRREVTEGSP